MKPTPVSVTCVPTEPLGGLKLRSCGVTRNCWLLVRAVPPVVTVTDPVNAPVGTVAVRKVGPESLMLVACTPPNCTTEELVNP